MQSFIASKTASYLSEKLGTEITIERVKVSLFDAVELEQLTLKDQKSDTLIHLNSLSTGAFSFNSKAKTITLNDVVLNEPYFNLTTYAGEESSNLQFLIDSLSSDTPSEGDWHISTASSSISNGRVNIRDFNYQDSLAETLNSHHLQFSQLNGNLNNLEIIGDSILFNTNNLSAAEKSGIQLSQLRTDASISPTGIRLKNSNIALNSSEVNGDILLNTNSYDDFSEYISSVRHSANLNVSIINLKDLNKFVTGSSFKDLPLEVSGKISGKINRLKAKNLLVKTEGITEFEGDLSLNGLPDINTTFIDLELENLTSNKTELEKVIFPAIAPQNIELPQNIAKLGNFRFNGDFTGFINDFVAYGNLRTPIGSLTSDLHFREINSAQRYAYDGKLNTSNFDLAELYSNPNLGKISSSFEVTGKGVTRDLADLTLSGTVPKISFGAYELTGITANGNLRDNFFKGQIISDNSDAQFDFKGLVDFTQKVPSYSFTSNIAHVSLGKYIPALNNIESFSTTLSLEGRGSNADNLQGELCLEESVIKTDEGEEILLSSIFLHSSLRPERDILLESNVLNAELRGVYTAQDIESSVRTLIDKINGKETNLTSEKEVNFQLTADILDFKKILPLINQDVYVSQRSHFFFSRENNALHMNVEADTISYDGYAANYINIGFHEVRGNSSLAVSSSEFTVGDSFRIIQPRITLEGDSIYRSNFSWNNGEENTSGNIPFDLSLSESYFELTFGEGTITTGPKTWRISPLGGLTSDGKNVEFSSVEVASTDQSLFLNGSLNNSENAALDLVNLDLATLNYFTPAGTTQFQGKIDGELLISDLTESNEAQSQLTISNLKLDDFLLGDIELLGNWNSSIKKFNLEGSLLSDNYKPFSFKGTYDPSNENSPLDLMVRATDFKLEFLSAVVKDAVSGFGGSLSGEVQVNGKITEPLLEGELFFNDATVKIDYLNTTYTLKDKIDITNDMFLLENTTIKDQEGNRGHLIGSVIHNNFREWSYDIFLDIEKTPFLCLNTTENQNELFFGKAYGAGFISVFGYDDYLEINATASTEKGTVINMPLGGSEEVVFEDFVVFKTPEDENTKTSNALSELASNFRLNIDLEIDVKEDAVFKMIFNEVTGDILEGNGKGHLSLIVNGTDDFQMYGSVEVVKGEYLFTLQNLINKDFDIKPGGSINWYGDPFLADIDLETVYKLSAPLYDLLGSTDDNQNYNKRVPVELSMDLEGKLLNPGIAFDVNLPSSDEITRNRVKSIISTEQEMNRQAFSLLVLKKFLSPSNFTGEQHNQLGIAENSSEFLSSQLSSWLSGITEDVDIGVNYRPGDEISSQEIALALSTQLFSDKLFISGNLGVTRGNEQNRNPNTLIGDVRIEYLLGKEGKIRLLVYNDTNNFDINTTNFENNSTQGVGLLYKEEFDSWDEFVSNFKSLISKKKDS